MSTTTPSSTDDRASPLLPAVPPPAAKHLSFAAVLTVAANTMNGPGLTTLPSVAVGAGLFFFVALVVLAVATVAYVCRRMVHAMWHGPAVADGGAAGAAAVAPRKPDLARTSLVGQAREAYGAAAGTGAAAAMVASSLCLALAQMTLCAAILDAMIVLLCGRTCGVGLEPTDGGWIHCGDVPSMTPFAGTGAPPSMISGGMALAAVATVGLGMVDLDEMMGAQYALFACLVFSCGRFCFTMHEEAGVLEEGYTNGTLAELTAAEVSPERWLGPTPFAAVGPIMFNFAFVVTAPPLSALAHNERGAYSALGSACAVMGTLYVLIGLFGAPLANILHVRGQLTEHEADDNTNLLSLVLSGSGGVAVLDIIAVSLFGLSQLASVPVYCLLAQETLAGPALGLRAGPAFVLARVVPWIVVAATYNASFFAAFVNWSGLLVLGYANFSLPLALDARLTRTRAAVRAAGGGDAEEADRVWIVRGVFALFTATVSAVIALSVASSEIVAGAVFLVAVALAALPLHGDPGAHPPAPACDEVGTLSEPLLPPPAGGAGDSPTDPDEPTMLS